MSELNTQQIKIKLTKENSFIFQQTIKENAKYTSKNIQEVVDKNKFYKIRPPYQKLKRKLDKK